MLRQEPIFFGGTLAPSRRRRSCRTSWACARAAGEITAACGRRRTRPSARCRPSSRPGRRPSFVSGPRLRAFLRPRRRGLSKLRPRSGPSIRACLGRTLTAGSRRRRSGRTRWTRTRAVGEVTAAPCSGTWPRTRSLPGSRPRRRSAFVLGASLGPLLPPKRRALSFLRRCAAGIRPFFRT